MRIATIYSTVFAVVAAIAAHTARAQNPPARENVPSTFATIEADRDHIYENEIFYVQLLIHSANPNLSDEFRLTGFAVSSAVTFETFQELAPVTRKHAGATYRVQRFKCRARAIKTGAVTVAPTLSGAVITTIKRDFFFAVQRVRTQIAIPVTPLKLTIHPLPPSGKPDDYSGLVGDISYDVKLSSQDVAVGDLVRITTVVSGDADLTDAAAAEWKAAPGLRTYDAKLLSDHSTDTKRVFEQVVVPLTTNVTSLSAVGFSYFDPRARAYKSVERGPFRLSVSKQKDRPREQLPETPSSSAEVELGPLKSAPAAWQRAGATPWYATSAFLASHLLPPVLLVILLVSGRRSERSGSAHDLKKSNEAALIRASELLAQARTSLDSDDIASGAEKISQAVSGYLCARFELAPGELSTDQVADLAIGGELPAKQARDLQKTIQLCEHVRFSGSSGNTDLAETAAVLKESLENILPALDILDRTR